MSNLVAIIAAVLGVIALVCVVGLMLSYPVMLLWNGCLVPAVDGVNTVTWLQTWGIIVLFGFLFKSQLSTK